MTVTRGFTEEADRLLDYLVRLRDASDTMISADFGITRSVAFLMHSKNNIFVVLFLLYIW